MLKEKRRAIAMIELIFAITVMGIVMLSAPMLINRATQSTYVALQQESIAAAAAQINMIMSSEWDALDANMTIGTPVLQTVSDTFSQCTSNTPPTGVTDIDGRYCVGKDGNRYFATAANALGPEGIEGNFNDDVDDYNGQSFGLSVYNSETHQTYKGDYIDKNITVSSSVAYGSDVPKNLAGASGTYATTTTFSNPFSDVNSSSSTNIKLITVTLGTTNTTGEINTKSIRLSTFMCNIGAPKSIRSRNNCQGDQ